MKGDAPIHSNYKVVIIKDDYNRWMEKTRFMLLFHKYNMKIKTSKQILITLPVRSFIDIRYGQSIHWVSAPVWPIIARIINWEKYQQPNKRADHKVPDPVE